MGCTLDLLDLLGNCLCFGCTLFLLPLRWWKDLLATLLAVLFPPWPLPGRVRWGGGVPLMGLDSQLLLGQPTPQQSSSEQDEQLSNTSKSNSAAVVLGPGLGSSVTPTRREEELDSPAEVPAVAAAVVVNSCWLLDVLGTGSLLTAVGQLLLVEALHSTEEPLDENGLEEDVEGVDAEGEAADAAEEVEATADDDEDEAAEEVEALVEDGMDITLMCPDGQRAKRGQLGGMFSRPPFQHVLEKFTHTVKKYRIKIWATLFFRSE